MILMRFIVGSPRPAGQPGQQTKAMGLGWVLRGRAAGSVFVMQAASVMPVSSRFATEVQIGCRRLLRQF
jgi:hypothetical protein